MDYASFGLVTIHKGDPMRQTDASPCNAWLRLMFRACCVPLSSWLPIEVEGDSPVLSVLFENRTILTAKVVVDCDINADK